MLKFYIQTNEEVEDAKNDDEIIENSENTDDEIEDLNPAKNFEFLDL